jgi:hypothetical protein
MAQLHTESARNTALGNTGVSFSTGIDAINTNPANLAFFDRKNWEISFIPQVHIDFDNSVFSYGTYKKYLTGDNYGNPKYLTDQDKNDILGLFPDGEPENITTSAIINIFSMAVNYKELNGGFGFAIRERIFNNSSIPKDALRLLLFGNKLNQNFTFDDFMGGGYWLREYALGYGFQFLKNGNSRASFGINLKYLRGTALYSMNGTKANFLASDTAIDGNIKFHAVYASADFLNGNSGYNVFGNAGGGESFDLGFSYISDDVYSIGVSLHDLGYIIWKKNVYEVNIDTTGIIKNFSDENEYKPFEDLIKSHKTKLDKKSIMLPYSVHAGISVNLQKTDFLSEYDLFPILLSAEFSSTFKTDYIMTRHVTYYGIGLEIKPLRWLPIRTGLSFGDMPACFSMGFGINTGNFDFDLAIGNISALFLSETTKSVSFAFSTKLLF